VSATASVPVRNYYGWLLLGVLWLVMAFNLALPIYGASVLNAYMADELHLSRATEGMIYSILTMMTGLPGPLVAMLIERVGIRWTMVIGNLVLVAGAAWMAAAVRTGFEAILACGIAVGLSDCIGGPIPAQAAAAYWFVRRRSLALAIVLSGSTAGAFFAAPLLNWITQRAHGDWRMGWWLIAACGAIAVLISAIFVRDKPSDMGLLPDGAASSAAVAAEPAEAAAKRGARVFVATQDWTVSEALRSPILWILMASALGFSCSLSLVLGQGISHMTDRGISPANAALGLSVSVAAGAVAHAIIGALGDYLEPRLIWAGCLILNAIGLLAFIRITPGAGLFVTMSVLGVAASGSMICMITLFANYYGPKAYAGVFGIVTCVQSTLGALAPFIAGYVYDVTHSYAPTLYVIATMCLLGGIAMFSVVRPPRHPLAQ
jgi:sugar phosphate permease